MVRRTGLIAVGAVALLVAAGSAMVLAQGPGPRGPRGGGPGFRGGLPLRELSLTDTQRTQVQQLVQKHREGTRALMESAMKARQAQQQAIEAVPTNESAIRSAAAAVADVEADLAVQQAQLQNEIFNLLTPEQQQQLQKVRADREARMKQRAQQRPQRRPA
ncbi:MAG: periplasmic heavy metal sensor [Acidobacteria bacterium]|nr:periplasmic heavy metal sensor [Acidobacteriota bacterium]